MKTFSIISTVITLLLPLIPISQNILPGSGPSDQKSIKQTPEIVIVDTEPITYIGLEATVNSSNTEAISNTMGQLYGQLMKYTEETGTESIGAPIAIFKSFGPDEVELVCGLPVEHGYVIQHEEIEVGETLGGKAVKATHMGDYSQLPFTHEKVNEYIERNNLRIVGHPYELYITDPEQVPDTAQWITEVYYPLGGG